MLENYPDSKSAAPAALNLASMNSEKGRLHDAAGYYEVYLKKETHEQSRTRTLNKMYALGKNAESKRSFAVAAELYGLVMVFANEDDPLRSKARAAAIRSLETLESSLTLEALQ